MTDEQLMGNYLIAYGRLCARLQEEKEKVAKLTQRINEMQLSLILGRVENLESWATAVHAAVPALPKLVDRPVDSRKES